MNLVSGMPNEAGHGIVGGAQGAARKQFDGPEGGITLNRAASSSSASSSSSSSNGRVNTSIPLHQQLHHARKRSLSSFGAALSSPGKDSASPDSVSSTATGPYTNAQASSSRRQRLVANNSHQSSSAMPSSSPVKFSANSSDFHLPVRSSTPLSPQLSQNSAVGATNYSTPSSGGGGAAGRTATASMSSAEADYGVTLTSLPLLRRAAAAAAFASANRVRLRRGSMLGREVANSDGLTSSEEDEEMDGDGDGIPTRPSTSAGDKSPSPQEILSRKRQESGAGVNDDDDDMQIETGDVSLENVQLDSKSRPSTPPPLSHRQHQMATLASSPTMPFESSYFHTFTRGAGARRGASRRGAAFTPRDRGVQRVAAFLRDEARPSDSEIASEAKLQRRLGPESDSITPTTPRLMAAGGARSPNPARYPAQAGGQTYMDDDEMMFQDHFDPYDAANSSDEDERSGMTTTTTTTTTATFGNHLSSANTALHEEDAVAVEEECANGIAIPGSTSAASHHDRIWRGFREHAPGSSAARHSPGTERRITMKDNRFRPTTTSTVQAGSGLSTSLGSNTNVEGITMDADVTSGANIATNVGHPISNASRSPFGIVSPSVWGKQTKRKLDSDRYEPYSVSLHKRRAVSPITVASAGGGVFQRARSSTPTTTGQSPLLTAVMANNSPLLTLSLNGIGNAGYGGSALPVPTPLSIPSPTLSIGSARGTGSALASGMYSKSVPSGQGGTGVGKWQQATAAGGDAATRGTNSPSSTRPSTPTNVAFQASLYGSGANPSPSLLSSSAGKMMAMGGAAPSGSGAGAGAGSNPSGGGSGPGYGSGALGLSLGSGSKRFKEELDEQEEQEGMLDDVNAIQLGEL